MENNSGRFKWYGLSFSKPMEAAVVAMHLAQEKFLPSEDFSKGFKVDKVGPEIVSAKFMSKSTIEKTIEFPVGGRFSQSITEFSTVDFHLEMNDISCVRIDQPPRGLTDLFNCLSLSLNAGCAIFPIEIDLLKVARLLRGSLNELDLFYIDVSEVYLDVGVQLRAAVQGVGDIESEIKEITRGKKFSAEGMKLRYNSSLGLREIEMTRKAGLKISKPLPHEDFIDIKMALLNSRK